MALYEDNKELAELILSKIPEDKLGEVLTQVDDEEMNALMIALNNDIFDGELVELIMDKIPENKLEEVLAQVDDNEITAMIRKRKHQATGLPELAGNIRGLGYQLLGIIRSRLFP